MEISFDLVADAMKQGFEKEFNIELITGNLTEYENELADKFEKECFASYDWNHKR